MPCTIRIQCAGSRCLEYSFVEGKRGEKIRIVACVELLSKICIRILAIQCSSCSATASIRLDRVQYRSLVVSNHALQIEQKGSLGPEIK